MSVLSDRNLEKDISQTGDFFKYLHGYMKSSIPFWDDFIQRGQRFQRSLEQTLVAFNSFLDGFAKLAEIGTHSKGATHEIGISLTNMIRWQKAMELKIRELNFSLSTKVLTPVGHRLDEWKKQLSNLEKDHEKEMHKPLKESKEVLKSTIKVYKTIESKRKKDKQTAGLEAQYEQLQTETDQRISDVEQKEKVHMSRIMVEERVWFSTLINAFTTVLDHLVTIGGDFERLPSLMSDLKESSASPSILPESKRDFIENWQIPSIHTPRLRGGSTLSTSSAGLSNLSRVDSAHSCDSSSSSSMNQYELNISAPIIPSTGTTLVQDPPQMMASSSSLAPPPPPQPIEDHYDVPAPVSSTLASISPSQVSLVSNGSHNSSESTTSSTRSASPQLSRTIQPHHLGHYPPPVTQPTPPINQSPVSSIYQSPAHHQLQQDNLPFVNRSDMTPNAMKYIPATLPRPRKESNPRPTLPKPNRNPSSSVQNHYQSPTHLHTQQQQQQHSYYKQQQPSFPQSNFKKQSSLTSLPDQRTEQQQDNDSDDENLSAFALALKQKKLRKTVHVSDRSNPHI